MLEVSELIVQATRRPSHDDLVCKVLYVNEKALSCT